MFENFSLIYEPVGWLCFYLVLLTSISIVLAFEKTKIFYIIGLAAVVGAIVGICWPLLLPAGALWFPFWLRDGGKKKQEQDDLDAERMSPALPRRERGHEEYRKF